MRPWAQVVASLLEVVYPEQCTLCGLQPPEVGWVATGPLVAGMRWWDYPHLCRDCWNSLKLAPLCGRVGTGSGQELAVIAAGATNPDLVKLVGQFKYHRVRGLAWPLARLLRLPISMAVQAWGPVESLVPVPLHPRRRRMRGFNQAELLARLATLRRGVRVRTDILVRSSNTDQQAKITTLDQRADNLAGAFRSPRSESQSGPAKASGRGLVLVDDLVTSGCTAVAAAECLKEAGWCVKGVVALGLAANVNIRGPRVDTWDAGF